MPTVAGVHAIVQLALSCALLTACAVPRGRSAPTAPALPARVFEIGAIGSVLAAVAGDASTVFAALSRTGEPSTAPGEPSTTTVRAAVPTTTIEARRINDGGASGDIGAPATIWSARLDGSSGPLVVSNGRVIAAIGGTGSVAGIALRGEPGSALTSFDAASGAAGWKLAVDATEWSVIASLAALPDGIVVGGSFAGTLRIGNRVVSSAGKSDGFVARLTAAGSVAWLLRVGGPGADAIQGVAAAADRIAIAGTFAAGADILGTPLVASDEKSPAADGFVAALDPGGALRWSATFGGPADDTVAGVAIGPHGDVAVAATARAKVSIGDHELVASGPADGLVAWWSATGAPGATARIGGSEFDGLRAITTVGDRFVVAGFYSGTMPLGGRTLTAGGGDDAFMAALDGAGRVVTAWPIGGDGREEVIGLAAVPGGFVAGISHTASARVTDRALPAPAEPLSGAAVAICPTH